MGWTTRRQREVVAGERRQKAKAERRPFGLGIAGLMEAALAFRCRVHPGTHHPHPHVLDVLELLC
jgi:hypothetical protein